MTQKNIQPGQTYTLPSGNIVKAGNTANDEVHCKYVDQENLGSVVVFTVGFLAKNGAEA